MNHLICYKKLPKWDSQSIPKDFLSLHNTKVDTWAKLTITKGKLAYYALNKENNILEKSILDTKDEAPFIPSQVLHKIEPLTENLQCQLSFYCIPKDYYQKKYQLASVHSEILELISYISSGNALDLGSGRGRNSLFLQQQGFNVTALDTNPNAIEKLNQIIEIEQLNNISASIGDANLANISNMYHLIISTVTFMFLSRNVHPNIIANMQVQTHKNGYNLVVCALDTDNLPCSPCLPFKSPMKSGELKKYYQHWNIKKYNEDIALLHRMDANGNPIELHFATLIAQKP